jgi:hypothetical protein
MLEMKSPDIMDLNPENEIEIFELEDAWLDAAVGGEIVVNNCPNIGCPVNLKCKPEV